MQTDALLGRDALERFGYKLIKISEYDQVIKEILSIEMIKSSDTDSLVINPHISLETQADFRTNFEKYYVKAERPNTSAVSADAR